MDYMSVDYATGAVDRSAKIHRNELRSPYSKSLS